MAVLLAIAGIGCGSGGDTTEAALTKAQFIKRGDAICHVAQEKKIKAAAYWLKKNKGNLKSRDEYSDEELSLVYLTVALPPVKEAAKELAALDAPSGDPKAEAVVKSLASAVEVLEDDPTIALDEAPYTRLDRLAAAYGFKSCSLFT
jgi:hypothetical protein